ncbi:hypothetical protein Y032_0880g2834 [Ancylostoma ceylanicum]|uniref:Uncharacterized protein n=1 Tax=Ancylostoma ceylanicum TaxID=53326 RepID=A0A016WAH6_9BILA|nr:hypothetical protein Y032_0880g2834 [Ancylostoma ceylanicum]
MLAVVVCRGMVLEFRAAGKSRQPESARSAPVSLHTNAAPRSRPLVYGRLEFTVNVVEFSLCIFTPRRLLVGTSFKVPQNGIRFEYNFLS